MRVSDKVVCIEPIQSVQCFKPVPEVGQVYVVREVLEAADGHGIQLVRVQGVYEDGEEVSLNPAKFRRLEDVRQQKARKARCQKAGKNRRRGWEPEINLKPGPAPQPDKDGKVALPIHAVKWMSAERWNELAQAQAEAFEVMKQAVKKVRQIHRKARIDTDNALLDPFLWARSETSRDKEPRFNLDLDRHCSALLRRALPKALPQELFNLVNGAVACALEAALDHRLVTLREAIAEAGARLTAQAMKPTRNDGESFEPGKECA